MDRNDILHSINNVVYGPSNAISIINNVGIKMFCFCLPFVFAVGG